MSDVIESGQQVDGPSVSREDIEEMLRQSRGNEERYQRERDHERAERLRVERERDTVAGHAQSEVERRYSAELQSANAELQAAQADTERAEDAYAAAMEAGDWKAAAKANTALADARNRAAQQTARKSYLEGNKENLTRAPVVREQRQPSDDYEKYVPDILQSEKAWLRDRPDFLTSDKYRQKVFAASALAIADGHDRGTDAYLRHMEQTLRETRQQQSEEERPAARDRGQSADLPPARRAAPGREPSNSRDFTLNEAQREAADAMFGNPHNKASYIADEGQRYRHYHEMNQKAQARR